MMKKRLSERVKAIIDLVPNCDSLADVGCDHAHISIYLKEVGRVKKVIASDLREKPLEKAKENVLKTNLTDSFEFRLCSGLLGYEKNEVETILISGMGGILMRDILAESAQVVKSAKFLILEPQSDSEEIRIYLKELGFEIEDERFVKEGEKFYPVIRAVKTEETKGSDKAVFDKFGPILLSKKDKLLYQFLLKKREKYYKIISSDGFLKEKNEETLKRFHFLKDELSYIEEALDIIDKDWLKYEANS